jgi:hypothetical protein
MLQSFPVLIERPGEFVAQFKYTVQLLPNGINVTTAVPFTEAAYASERTLPEELAQLLAVRPTQSAIRRPGSDAPKREKKRRSKKKPAAESEA